MTTRTPVRRQAGLSLIELMVAMVLGLLVAAGIVSVFISTSSSNRAQNQLARLQEEGRFAITQLGQDLSQANGQYCTNSGGNATQSATTGIYLDGLRAPMVYADDLLGAISDLSTRWGSPYPAQPAMPYYLPSFLSMRGYECSAASCSPDPGTIANAPIPAMGKAVGQRVIGADVLTVRYVDASKGWALGGSSTIDANDVVNLAPGASEPPVSHFRAGDLAMLADCSSAQVYAADVAGGTITPKAQGAGNLALPTPLASVQGAPKLFDFNQDFQTVTYYLKVVDGDGSGHLTGALIRRVNGVDNELVRGIERLDFKYGVEHADGTTSYLTAGQVDAAAADQCPPSVPSALGTDAGCLWRAVKSIEVDILMDGQIPLFTLTQDEMQYTYASDATPGLAAPSAHAVTPAQQGFAEPMIRREFTALVSVRNFNP
jgi:type IV pilus assembly protein PilW